MTATFPLIPRRRVLGLPFGALHSVRRGLGSDIAGSRPYLPGDDVDRIDWHASARLSLAKDSDEFIVREHYADEAPRVIILCDRRPSMAVFGAGWPFLAKPQAIRAATLLVASSTVAARGLLGYFDEAVGSAFWRPPRSEHALDELELGRSFRAPEDTLARGLEYLRHQRRDVPAGTFLFVLSDFLVQPTWDQWLLALERQWELVPVVVRDPTWEQSFPDVADMVIPIIDPATGRALLVRFTAADIEQRRRMNEERQRELILNFRGLGMDPVVVSSDEPSEVLTSFLSWADERLLTRGWT